MKVALICPSNMLYMPYVENYKNVLKELNVDYTVINWDRFQIEDVNDNFKYRDRKIGHKRSYFDYLKYKNFVVKKLRAVHFDKIIIFGIQLSYFLRKILAKDYQNKFIFDIRDHNKIIDFFKIKKVIRNSNFTVISSAGYKEWLPGNCEYIINHNTAIENIPSIKKTDKKITRNRITISYIGTLTNYQENVNFIDKLKNKDGFYLNFHGDGIINEKIENYIEENKITNITISGRYEKEEENKFYDKAQLINMFLYNNNINNRTCLSNRLYKATIHGKPLLALEGTYLANIIKKNNLGLVTNSFEGIEYAIKSYIRNFDGNKYRKSRERFLNSVIKDNDYFEEKLKQFIIL